jgi:hypothetical protein
MSCGCQSTGKQPCGCCAGITRETPALIVNRPALPAIRYRVGTYSSFMATMLAGLSSSEAPALAGLRTRSSSDFSIALVDAWSEVLDILTFYTERLANEAYLGTAVQGRSVFELVRLIGYKPSPGVSASAVLAFTLANAPGSPASVLIAQSSRVQSVPGPGQTPQVFETSTPLTATIAANAIPAATTKAWRLASGDTSTWIVGTTNNIHPGDALLFLRATNGTPSTKGPAAICYVTAVQIDSASGNTNISWDRALPSSVADDASGVCVYCFGSKAGLFGVGAAQPAVFSHSILKFIVGNPGDPHNDWNWQYSNKKTINLDATYAGLNPTATPTPAQMQWMVLVQGGSAAYFQIQSATETNPGAYGVSSKTTQLVLETGTVISGSAISDLNKLLNSYVQNTRLTTAYVQSRLLSGASIPLTALGSMYAPGMLTPVKGSGLTLAGLQTLAEGAPVGISGKRVRIVSVKALSSPAGFTPSGAISALPVSANQPFLIDAYPPTNDPATGNLLWSVLTVTGQPGTLSVPPAAVVLQPSVSSDPVTGEAAVISTVEVDGDTTQLTFELALERIYDTPTVAVNANAVLATHGETVLEILGSGDATNSALEFQLKQSPLTYTSAATTNGAQSTLQVRVNQLLWNEGPNFLDSAASDRAYVTRPNYTGGPTVQFGDGIEGSRTPTGQSNIVAQYRKGIGLAGMVAPLQLTQALDRPQGLQSVTNPGPATGGADPATPAEARQSAPLPTLTLGRVVSLEDYQNFALNFAGIALALATWTWFGNTRGVFLTLAGAGGTTLGSSDQVVQKLIQQLQTSGLPYVQVLPVSYVPALFEIGLQVKVDSPTYDPTTVLPQVWQSLVSAFSFGQMQPAQSVAASRVIQIAQSIPGVIAVNLTALKRKGSSATSATMLCASGPNPSANPPTGAEILLLDPACQANVGVWL